MNESPASKFIAAILIVVAPFAMGAINQGVRSKASSVPDTSDKNVRTYYQRQSF